MLFKEAYSVSLEMCFGYQLSLIGYGSAYINYVHTCLNRTYRHNNCGLRPEKPETRTYNYRSVPESSTIVYRLIDNGILFIVYIDKNTDHVRMIYLFCH